MALLIVAFLSPLAAARNASAVKPPSLAARGQASARGAIRVSARVGSCCGSRATSECAARVGSDHPRYPVEFADQSGGLFVRQVELHVLDMVIRSGLAKPLAATPTRAPSSQNAKSASLCKIFSRRSPLQVINQLPENRGAGFL
jgi:hypothetical protein